MLPKGLPVCPAQGSNYSCVRKFVHARMLSSVQLYPMDCTLPGFSVHGIFQARIMGVGCHFLLQGIFPIQGSNQSVLHWQVDSSTQTSWEAHKKAFSGKNLLPVSQPRALPFLIALYQLLRAILKAFQFFTQLGPSLLYVHISHMTKTNKKNAKLLALISRRYMRRPL